MQLQTITLASAIIGAISALETHGGYDYETRFKPDASPETNAIKDSYEATAAEQAYTRLQEKVQLTGVAHQCLNFTEGAQPATLYALKDCIAADSKGNFFKLLAEDIENSNDFWGEILLESTNNRTQWVPARAWTKCYFNGDLTAVQFAAWSLSPNADAANLHANPEHFYKETTLDASGSQSSQIFEGWGGVLSKFGTARTNFLVPAFSTPVYGTENTPAAWDIGVKFPLPLQRVGDKVLASGGQETFGVLHIAVRDFAASEGTTGKSGIEIYSAVWYPPWDQASEEDKAEFVNNYLADEAHHMVVEVINLTLQAHEDCKTGLCVLPSGK
ncbi:hypothetical protein F5Y14DRAFT_412451 [Nemania sp. NC0429]|nr:hypothetical protein F5Y14DRAFT_412451 [Nemania sp. NC0429]